MDFKTKANNDRIRALADDGDFSFKDAEQLILAGCPSNMARRVSTVAEGRGCSIAAAYALLVKEDKEAWAHLDARAVAQPAAKPVAPARSQVAKPPVAAALPAPSQVKPAPTLRVAAQPAPVVTKQNVKPIDTWDAAIAAVHHEFGIRPARS